MYRKIHEIMLISCQSSMKNYDPFEKAKLETVQLTQKNTSNLIKALCPLETIENNSPLLKQKFHNIIQVI